MKLNYEKLREDVRKVGVAMILGGGLGFFTDKVTSFEALFLSAFGTIVLLAALFENESNHV
jgi:lipoprotein signal peptidase